MCVCVHVCVCVCGCVCMCVCVCVCACVCACVYTFVFMGVKVNVKGKHLFSRTHLYSCLQEFFMHFSLQDKLSHCLTAALIAMHQG